jgi:hypothetical protein
MKAVSSNDQRLRSGEAGATLIEAVVAMLLFTFVVLGFANSVINSGVTGDSSRRRVQATLLAMDMIERLRPLPAGSAELIVGTHADGNNPITGKGKKGGRYTRTWEITEDAPVPGMLRVVTRVTWRDPGHTRRLSLATYLSPQ